jgi:hypothetical protein
VTALIELLLSVSILGLPILLLVAAGFRLLFLDNDKPPLVLAILFALPGTAAMVLILSVDDYWLTESRAVLLPLASLVTTALSLATYVVNLRDSNAAMGKPEILGLIAMACVLVLSFGSDVWW